MDIRSKIKAKGFSLSDVAKRMKSKRQDKNGISLPALIQIIDGNPTIDKLREIATIIGCSVSELLAEDDDKINSAVICPHCGKSISIYVEVDK